MNRRDFLKMVAAAGATSAAGSILAGSEVPLLKLGVLSDIHLRCFPHREDYFRKALLWFRDKGADAVVIAGDIADSGRVTELKLCADTWFSVFPDDKAPDGRRVERLFVFGNHCVDAWRWAANNPHYRSPISNEAQRLADSIGYADVRQRAWRELFHEDFAPIWMKTVNGIPIVGAHWEKRGDGIAIEEFMKVHGKMIDPTLPFFYIQHEHPKDTCFGSWAWGHDDGRSTRALSRFPKAVAFSGHSHYSLTDERTVWQGAFTSINTASLFDVSLDFSLRENASGNRFGYKGEKRPHRMPALAKGDVRQGQFVTVYCDKLVVERHDFKYDLPLGCNWEVPLPAAAGGPFSYASRRARRTAPAFGPNAKVEVRERNDPKGEVFYDVTFPRADSRNGCRVFEYEVTATLVADEVDLVQAQRRVLAPDFHLPECEKLMRGGACTFSSEDLQLSGEYRFSVRPVECFGLKGGAIESSPFTISAKGAMQSAQKG